MLLVSILFILIILVTILIIGIPKDCNENTYSKTGKSEWFKSSCTKCPNETPYSGKKATACQDNPVSQTGSSDFDANKPCKNCPAASSTGCEFGSMFTTCQACVLECDIESIFTDASKCKHNCHCNLNESNHDCNP